MLKEISRASIGLAVILSVATLIAAGLYTPDSTSAVDCTSSPCNTTFQVNVQESLAVSITTPTDWDSGDVGDFLRNTVTLSVTSNNATGFTASMYANSTSLTNTSKSTVSLPNLEGSTTRSAFPADHWGYSLDVTNSTDASTPVYNGKIYNETTSGNNNSYYHPLTTSAAPATVLVGEGATTGTSDIYFGAKASIAQASGTYAGTVVFNVVTGTVNYGDTTPEPAPTNPVTPVSDGTAVFNGSSTAYTTTTTSAANNTTTTTTQISEGDNTSYYDPQGVTESSYSSNVSNSSPLAIGLATAAAVAAVSGGALFALSKRQKDDDEE